jgi:hypothetical protein
MIRNVISLGGCVLLGAACALPAEPELAEEAIEAETELVATPSSWWPGNPPPPPVCQPGTKVGQCYDWSTGCYESPQCGAGCKTYRTGVCDQYRMSSNGQNYYYRSNCTVTVTCNGPLQGQGCVQTCT